MSGLRFSITLSMLLGLLAVTPTNAQVRSLPELSSFNGIPTWFTPNWACGPVWPPLGFYVDSVTDDGRYVTLEDSTIWEVQPTQRAGVAAWQEHNFVEVHPILAPTGDYEWLFTNVDQPEARVAVRPAGWVRR